MADFSLFEGDPTNRFFSAGGFGTQRPMQLVSRVCILLWVTAVPPAIFSMLDGFGPGQPRALNFFGDISAMAQAFLGYPLFVLSEVIIGKKTRATAKHFLSSGIVPDEHVEDLRAMHQRITSFRQRLLPELICLALGFLFAWMWLYEETHNLSNTWHAIGVPGFQWPTKAGWWLAFVSIPIFNFWWLRWIWKIGLWSWYLFKVSRYRLRIIASHPDMTGGLEFLSEAQASFAIVVFTFGIGLIAPLVAYKVDVEGASFLSFSLGGPFLGFVLGAPIFFSLPLLMFTKQLSRVKKRAIDAYHERATDAARQFEQRWLHGCSGDDCEVLFGAYLSGMNNLKNAYSHIREMRVVPFDIRSFGQLLGSTVGSLIPILPKLVDLPEPAMKTLEVLKRVMGG